MQYLVQLRLSSSARPMTPSDGIAFIERFIFPTLERCKHLQQAGKIAAGGPVSGSVALALIVNVESPKELDGLITSLPLWSRMEADVTPLSTFDDRLESIAPLREALKAQLRESGTPTPGGV